MINYLIDNEIPFVIVLTKADKLKPMARKARMEAFREEIPCFDDIHCVPFSAVTGEGVEQLREMVEEVRADWYENAYEDETEETAREEPFSGFLQPRRNRS